MAVDPVIDRGPGKPGRLLYLGLRARDHRQHRYRLHHCRQIGIGERL
jgi:hypothetical protein